MAEIMKSPSSISGGAMTSRFSLAAKLYSIFALFAVLVAAITVLSDYNTRQNAAPYRSGRDREPRRAQRRARQFAGLCGGDGIPRRLHVDRTRRGEEIRRRIAQVQRTHSRGRQELAGAGPGRRRPAVRHLQEAHRTIRRLPQGAGSPRGRDQCRCRPRMGRQRRQPRSAYGAEQGSRGAVQGLRRTQQEAGATDRHQPHDGLCADLPRRASRWSWSL